jgi:hypothetical protein
MRIRKQEKRCAFPVMLDGKGVGKGKMKGLICEAGLLFSFYTLGEGLFFGEVFCLCDRFALFFFAKPEIRKGICKKNRVQMKHWLKNLDEKQTCAIKCDGDSELRGRLVGF